MTDTQHSKVIEALRRELEASKGREKELVEDFTKNIKKLRENAEGVGSKSKAGLAKANALNHHNSKNDKGLSQNVPKDAPPGTNGKHSNKMDETTESAGVLNDRLNSIKILEELEMKTTIEGLERKHEQEIKQVLTKSQKQIEDINKRLQDKTEEMEILKKKFDAIAVERDHYKSQLEAATGLEILPDDGNEGGGIDIDVSSSRALDLPEKQSLGQEVKDSSEDELPPTFPRDLSRKASRGMNENRNHSKGQHTRRLTQTDKEKRSKKPKKVMNAMAGIGEDISTIEDENISHAVVDGSKTSNNNFVGRMKNRFESKDDSMKMMNSTNAERTGKTKSNDFMNENNINFSGISSIPNNAQFAEFPANAASILDVDLFSSEIMDEVYKNIEKEHHSGASKFPETIDTAGSTNSSSSLSSAAERDLALELHQDFIETNQRGNVVNGIPSNVWNEEEDLFALAQLNVPEMTNEEPFNLSTHEINNTTNKNSPKKSRRDARKRSQKDKLTKVKETDMSLSTKKKMNGGRTTFSNFKNVKQESDTAIQKPKSSSSLFGGKKSRTSRPSLSKDTEDSRKNKSTPNLRMFGGMKSKSFKKQKGTGLLDEVY